MLGAMLSSPDAAAKAIEVLTQSDFAYPIYQTIFGACLGLFNAGKPVDAVTVSSELECRGILDETGGAALLRSLCDGVPNVAHHETYVQAVKDASTARQVLKASYDLQGLIKSGDTNPKVLMASIERDLFRINEQAAQGEFHSLYAIADERYSSLGDEPLVKAVSTGFENLDAFIDGFVPGRVYVLAARPGVGKTSLALNIAHKVSCSDEGSVLVYSLEMSKEELSDRIVSSVAGVVSKNIQTGILDPEEYARVFRAAGATQQANMFIHDKPSLTMQELRAKTRLAAANKKVALVVIDYLQLLSYDGKRWDNRQQEVAAMSGALKHLAREADVPILVLSQLNRDLEGRRDKKPQLSDIRESGAVEQDADAIMFIWFDPDDPSGTLANIIFAKHRHGPTGEAVLLWTREFTRFLDYRAAT